MSFSMLSKPEAASWTAFSSALVVKLLMLSFRLQPVVMRSTAIVGAITPWEKEKIKESMGGRIAVSYIALVKMVL